MLQFYLEQLDAEVVNLKLMILAKLILDLSKMMADKTEITSVEMIFV